MITFEITKALPRFKVGDKVQRAKGYHGMGKGDRGTIYDICFKDGEVYIALRECLGWHKEDNFEIVKLSEENLIRAKINELEKQLEEILNTPEELHITYINGTEVSNIYQGLLNMKFYKQNRKVICKIFNNDKIVGKGVAKAMEEDEFDVQIGINLALNRAIKDLCNRREKKIIKSTF